MHGKSFSNQFAIVTFALLMASFLIGGCTSPKGMTVRDRREYVQDMRDDTLSMLYRRRPELRNRVQAADGYAVFSNINAHALLITGGSGYGLVRNNGSQHDTFMRMGQLGLGVGLGAKDFRAVFIFHDPDTMYQFITDGWEFGLEGDLAAKSNDKGGAETGKHTFTSGMEIYQITDTGVVARVALAGTRYWRDSDLN